MTATTPTTQAPVFFISHGAPTFAIEPGKLGPQLQALGAQLSGVRTVLVVMSPLRERMPCVPVCISMKQPVP